MTKHLINKQEEWTRESLKGYLYANNLNLIALEEHPNVILRKDYLSMEGSISRVAILTGGGSGHEPAHLGFIGHGMLTGVICGDLFASPSTAAILDAIRFVAASNKAGVLLIVKNYTGDRLNFGLAAKRAQLEGINVDWILVDDDVAMLTKDNSDQKDKSVGRRGLCGTILIEKLAGALAEQRKSLKEIKKYLDDIIESGYLRTLGISLSGRVILPGESIKAREAENDLIEVGLGIHGEAGRRKIPIASSHELAKLVLNDYLLDSTIENETVNQACLMINNLGGLSNLELYTLVNDCVQYLLDEKPNLKIRRIYAGTFMTSLNMIGFSITLIYLDNKNSETTLNLLDLNTSAPAWPKTCGRDLEPFSYNSSNTKFKSNEILIDDEKYIEFANENAFYSDLYKFSLKAISDSIIMIKDTLNELDSNVGDGDCGNSLAKVCEKILNDIKNNKFNFKYPHRILLNLSFIFENGGGSLCILLALFFSAAAKAFSQELANFSNENHQIYFLKIWLNALKFGIEAVQNYGRAKPNQRSIIDPLVTIENYFSSYIQSVELSCENQIETKKFLKDLVDVTYESAKATSKMIPQVGRASYVDPNLVKAPDAGAFAVSTCISQIYLAYLMYFQ